MTNVTVLKGYMSYGHGGWLERAMYRWKHNSDHVRVRGFAISIAWIVVLLGGYWLLAEWHQLPALASSLFGLMQ